MTRITTIELSKEYLKFSAAHFTIFSATERERLHGHNFAVRAKITAPVGDNGMTFSYKLFKQKLESLCAELDEYLILPTQSPYLKVSEQGAKVQADFNDETMEFLASDVLLLPIRNATVEEYSHYLLDKLLEDQALLGEYGVQGLEIGVSSGPGQWGSSCWEASS